MVKWCHIIMYFVISHDDTYIFHQATASLVQVIAWNLFSTKTLSAPVLIYCQLEPTIYFIEILIKFQGCLSKQLHFRILSWPQCVNKTTICKWWYPKKYNQKEVPKQMLLNAWNNILNSDWIMCRTHCADTRALVITYFAVPNCTVSYQI